jgi:hypothetical protein
VASIYSTHFKYAKHMSIRDTENWFALLERTTHQVQYFSVWAPFVARRMSKRYSISRCVFQHLGCHRSNCIADSCTNFNHTTNFWTEYLVLYIAPKEKIQGGSRTISTMLASTDGLPAPLLCRTLPVSWICSSHRLMDCFPGAFSPYSRP